LRVETVKTNRRDEEGEAARFLPASAAAGPCGWLGRLAVVTGDMLSADVSAAGVVVLTSQCWDRPLVQRVHAKLAAELPAGEIARGLLLRRAPRLTFACAELVGQCAVHSRGA